jgi:UDP-N-acetylmuramoylalanine--D-glutamate ligase
VIVARTFAGEAVGIFGLARSGLSSARALRDGAACVFAWDDKDTAHAEAAKLGATVQPWEQWPWAEIKALILSPGVPLTHPAPHPVVRAAKAHGAEVIGDIELFARAVRPDGNKNLAPIIAVTGTNGKSTTTALIGHILQSAGYDAQVGGNIGRPALDLASPTDKTVYVLEASSYQIDLSPGLVSDVAILSNLALDHIDRHGSMENYAALKARLLEHADKAGHVAVGVDDSYCAAVYTRLAAAAPPEAVAVSVGKVLGRGIFVIDGKLYDACSQPAAQVCDLSTATHLPGAHNWQNAALSYAAVKKLVRDPRAVANAINRFPGLAHRIELVGCVGKVRFINDSKATNADAAARALACYSDIYWIAGGRPKEGGIANLAPFFPRIRKAYLIGEAAKAFGETLAGKVDAVQAGTLDRALTLASLDAQMSQVSEPVVLLSPACASFDQFRDYEQRGDMFRASVKTMMEASNPARAHA